MKVFYYLYLLAALGCKKSSGNDQPNPKVSIADASINEGNNGNTSMAFTVSLDVASRNTVSITLSTVQSSAIATEDFSPVQNQQLIFQPGETSKPFTVSIVGDIYREGDESFDVMIIGASGAAIDKFKGKGTIINDDTRINFTNAGYDAPAGYPGYTLAWGDEFDNGTLDMGAWSFENGDGCPGICGWGNNELEYYKPENLFFQDGKLIIEAKNESFGGKNYTSSKIVSRGKKKFKFARIDIRARLPRGKGIWPALWMLPQDNVYGGWPRSGEIDIMELVGHEPGKVYGTLHYGPGPGSIQTSRNYSLPGGATFNDEFHVFSLEWKADQIKWFVDGNLYSTVNKSDLGAVTYPFNEDFFFIFNLAVGGNWPGNPDSTTSLPQWMIVDYIRVYQM